MIPRLPAYLYGSYGSDCGRAARYLERKKLLPDAVKFREVLGRPERAGRGKQLAARARGLYCQFRYLFTGP